MVPASIDAETALPAPSPELANARGKHPPQESAMSRSLLLPFLVMIVIGTSVAWAGDDPTLALTGFDPVLLSQGNERAGLEELTVGPDRERGQEENQGGNDQERDHPALPGPGRGALVLAPVAAFFHCGQRIHAPPGLSCDRPSGRESASTDRAR